MNSAQSTSTNFTSIMFMWLYKIVKVFLASVIVINITTVTSLDIVDTNKIELPQGNIVGLLSVFDGYKKYLGIPYASIPGRFQDPGDPPKWSSTLYATRYSDSCSQVMDIVRLPVGREDCQLLNVYTPLHRDTRGYPIMVFLHGGGFYWGSNTDLLYNPKYLVQKGVIVVTVNYRLGAFGFLCLHNKEAPGNAGLKDQTAALRWVRTNIKYFGGDPHSVTLFGQSAGAAAVNYHILSPLSRGLFHRAIMQSGSALIPFAFDRDPVKTASEFGATLGYNVSNPDKLLQIFKEMPATDLARATSRDSINDALAPYIFSPCAEKVSSNAFITRPPEDLLESVNLDPNFKLIIGFNSMEGIYYADRYKNEGVTALNDNFDDVVPANINFATPDDRDAFITDVKKFYFKNSTLLNNFQGTDGLIHYFSDAFINYPSIATTEYLLRNSKATIYNYYFTYDSLRNLNKFLTQYRVRSGASHGDELFYIFDPVLYRFLPATSNDRYLIDIISTMWTNFAKTGNPTFDVKDLQWVNSELNRLRFLEIGNHIKMTDVPNKERINFWKGLYATYNNRQSL